MSLNSTVVTTEEREVERGLTQLAAFKFYCSNNWSYSQWAHRYFFAFFKFYCSNNWRRNMLLLLFFSLPLNSTVVTTEEYYLHRPYSSLSSLNSTVVTTEVPFCCRYQWVHCSLNSTVVTTEGNPVTCAIMCTKTLNSTVVTTEGLISRYRIEVIRYFKFYCSNNWSYCKLAYPLF